MREEKKEYNAESNSAVPNRTVWWSDNQFGSLLATLELRTPLRTPSNLKELAKMQEIYSRSEGTLGDKWDLFEELAVDAIRSKTENINLEGIRTLQWVPPSKRKQYKRL